MARMLAFIAILHLFFVIFLFFALGPVVEEGYRSQFIDYVRSDAFNFSSSLSGGDFLILNHRALEETVLSGRTVYVDVYDANEKIYASFGHSPSLGAYRFQEDFHFGQGGDAIYHIAADIYDKHHQLIGRLHIGYDESGTVEQIFYAYKRGSIYAALYVSIALIFSVLFSHHLTRPLKLLRKLSKQIAHGKYQTEISVPTYVYEINSLATTLEFMRKELVAQSDSMEHLALHDSLTGLPNRVLLEDRVNQTIYGLTFDVNPCVLAIIDLDRFKDVNDSFGHIMGDNMLKQVAARITHVLRKSDTVARLGGDEFAIFFPNTSRDLVTDLIASINRNLLDAFNCDGHFVSIGASIGLSVFPEDGASYEELLKRADVAMYSAKRAGGGAIFYLPYQDKDSLAHLMIVSDLRVAIERSQFYAVYQPKMGLICGEFSGVEVLIRWRHPTKGVISPVEFIPLAERSGLISRITQVVLIEAVSQAVQWMKAGIEIPIAVNLSPFDFADEYLMDSILELIERYKFPAYLLELEITESGFFADPLRAKEILDHLAQAGIKITIDDFGTGYSSLAQLRKMPVSILKIDRSFVFNMIENANDDAIVSATILMAHQMGIKVVAEGVEDSETLLALSQLGCDYAQGYLFAKPMLADEFLAWVKRPPKTTDFSRSLKLIHR